MLWYPPEVDKAQHRHYNNSFTPNPYKNYSDPFNPYPPPQPPSPTLPCNNSHIMSPLQAAIRLPNHQCCYISPVPLYHCQVHLPKARTLHLVLTSQPRWLNTISQCMISPRITTVVAANPSRTISVITMTRSKIPLVMWNTPFAPPVVAAVIEGACARCIWWWWQYHHAKWDRLECEIWKNPTEDAKKV